MICKECGEDLKHKAHGLCKKCYGANYRKTHKKEIKQSNKVYRIANLDKIKRNVKIWKEANRDKTRASDKKWGYANGREPMAENKACSAHLGVHIAENVLSKIFKDVQETPYGHKGYDFICNKGKKIDVKSSCIYIDKRSNSSDIWSFHIGKNKIADFFLCLAFDNRKNLNPLHIWLIPGRIVNHLKKASISESTLLKWNEHALDISKVVSCCDSMKVSDE